MKRVFSIIFFILLMSLLIFPALKSAAYAQEGVMIELPDPYIAHSIKYKTSHVNASLNISYGNDIEVREIRDGLFHLRQRGWDDFFLSVDVKEKKLYGVTGGIFGIAEPGKTEPINNVTVSMTGGKNGLSENLCIRFSSPGRLLLKDGRAQFSLKIGQNHYYIYDDIEYEEAGTFLYHVRPRWWKDFYWEADLKAKTLKYVTTDLAYGKKSTENAIASKGTRVLIDNVSDFVNTFEAPVLKVADDLGLPSSTDASRSEWVEAQKAAYRSLLGGARYDVLVAPFQVRDYAVDHSNRSLMTRYLASRIEHSTGLKVADPTLVERALGENARRFNPNDIYRLAEIVGAKYVLIGFAGHAQDEQLKLTIFVHGGKDGFRKNPEPSRIEPQAIPFSDSNPPAEAFRAKIYEIFSTTPLPVKKELNLTYYPKQQNLELPVKPGYLGKTDFDSPVINAYYLQLIGMLYPQDRGEIRNDTTKREHLFERSIAALESVSPKSPDYTLIKARAYFYLHSRPAAIEALGKADTPEKAAFKAFLDGNLPELEKRTAEISSPLLKLFATIESSDLRGVYHSQLKEEEMVDIASKYKEWEWLVFRRLASSELWNIQPNFVVKEILDSEFPVDGPTAKDLEKRIDVKGESPYESEELNLSILTHYRSAFKSKKEAFASVNGAARPVELDMLDLYYYSGEANIWKTVKHLLLVQGLNKDAHDIIKKMEPEYRDNLEFTHLKIKVLEEVAEEKDYDTRTSLYKDIDSLKKVLCIWTQGQSPFAPCESDGYFDRDYPKKWKGGMNNLADRKTLKKPSVIDPSDSRIPDKLRRKMINHELNLMYTNNSFWVFKDYYSELMRLNLRREAQLLVEANKNRFTGSSSRTDFIAEILKRKGETASVVSEYEKQIVWDLEQCSSYHKLGRFQLENGDYKKALDTFNRYPRSSPELNAVRMSNCLYDFGMEFFNRADVNRAAHFLKLASESDTGAGSQFFGAGYKFMMDGDYQSASKEFLGAAKRYNDNQAYMYYTALLHIMGYSKDAWTIINSMKPEQHIIYTSLVGFRMEGKDEQAQLDYLINAKFKLTSDQAQRFAFMLNSLDRMPPKELQGVLLDAHMRTKKRYKQKEDDAEATALGIAADGYALMRHGQYNEAFEVMQRFVSKHFLVENGRDKLYGFSLPYLVRSGMKSNRAAESEKIIEAAREIHGIWMNYHLAKAFVAGYSGRHTEAVKHLKDAHNAMPNVLINPQMPWHQLVEACEWLYEDTGREEYRELALQWAKAHQKIQPMFAWAYAAEAKYTKNKDERVRALAIALYLDKRSERLSSISNKDKEDALKWLEKNNPFL